ncbi:MAG: hypothetical protein NTX13_15720 [Acidobacteria bacterium]|nr:hypothetical protein [Acidobacteriota bacterium]
MSNTPKNLTPEEVAELGFDRTEVQTVPVLVVTVAIVGFIVAVCIGCAIYYNSFRDAAVERIQLEPVSKDYLDLQTRESQQLNTYGRLNKAAGTVRLPIDKAMALVVVEAAPGGNWKFPVTPYPVKKPEDAAPAATSPANPPAPAK